MSHLVERGLNCKMRAALQSQCRSFGKALESFQKFRRSIILTLGSLPSLISNHSIVSARSYN